MAKVIEFYVPKSFRKASVRSAKPQPGKVIEFCSRSKTSVSNGAADGVLAWLLVTTESDLAVRW